MNTWRTAVSATLHCLTGCAIGEVLGMIIGTALEWSNGATIAASIVLAFFFGYSLTSMPLLRAGLGLRRVVPLAFASDTLSITTMEIVDTLIIVLITGAMAAGLGDPLFWGSLAVALLIAGVFAMLFVRERRLWIWLQPGAAGTEMTAALSSTRRTLDGDAEFERIRQALLPAPATEESR